MPIYVYEREDGTTFERLQKVSDEALTTCPETGQKVRRKISATAIRFKGSGFYETDYKPSTATSSDSEGSSTNSGSSNAASSGAASSGDSAASCNDTSPSGGCKSCAQPSTSNSGNDST